MHKLIADWLGRIETADAHLEYDEYVEAVKSVISEVQAQIDDMDYYFWEMSYTCPEDIQEEERDLYQDLYEFHENISDLVF